jgi:hypothetical protein
VALGRIVITPSQSIVWTDVPPYVKTQVAMRRPVLRCPPRDLVLADGERLSPDLVSRLEDEQMNSTREVSHMTTLLPRRIVRKWR